MIPEFTAAAISQRLRCARPTTSWCGRVRQQPPFAPRARTLYCAWLVDPHGTLGFASETRFPPPPADRAGFTACALAHHCALLDPEAVFELEPVRVPKAWGAEVWFTGIEPRGESRIVVEGRRAPLGYALALFPDLWGASAPLLVKELHAHHEPIAGELYFEVHADKREVYFVTEVDPRAWPAGQARVRFGLRSAARANPAILEAPLRRFEAARLAVDRAAAIDGTGLTPARHIDARRRVPKALLEAERQARANVDRLIAERRLAPGARLEVPPGTPHGLRHGIRVIEVQTPSYERAVLYASQPLAGRGSWDIERGIALIGAQPPVATVVPGRWEALPPGAELSLTGGRYALCHVVSGRLRAGTLTLSAGGTCLGKTLTLSAGEATNCVVVEAS